MFLNTGRYAVGNLTHNFHWNPSRKHSLQANLIPSGISLTPYQHSLDQDARLLTAVQDLIAQRNSETQVDIAVWYSSFPKPLIWFLT